MASGRAAFGPVQVLGWLACVRMGAVGGPACLRGTVWCPLVSRGAECGPSWHVLACADFDFCPGRVGLLAGSGVCVGGSIPGLHGAG